MSLRSPSPPFCAASVRLPCGSRRRLWDFLTDSRAPRPLQFCSAGSYTNVKNHKSVTRRHVVVGIVQSPHGHRAVAARSKTTRWRYGPCSLFMEAARAPYDYRLEAAETAQQLHWDCTIFCMDLPWLAPEGPYKKSHNARRQCEHIRRSP